MTGNAGRLWAGMDDRAVEWGPSVAFLKTSIGLILAVVMVYVVGLSVFAEGQGLRVLLATLFALVALVAWVLITRGRTNAAVWVMTAGVWTLVSVTSLFLGGMAASTPVVYPVLVLLAGWMFSIRAAVGLAILTACTTLGMVLADWQGWLPQGPPTMPVLRWYVLCIALALSASLIGYFAHANQLRLTETRKLGDALAERAALLEASQAELHAVLGATADGILAVDRDNHVLHANRRFAELWRVPQAMLDSRDDAALLAHVTGQLSDPQGFMDRVKALYDSEAVALDRIEFTDGRTFERHTEPLMRNGVMVGRVWSFSDITERLRAEAEVAALNASLEARVEARTAELKAANRELESFSYTVSHDLRAPLRAMSGFAGLLAEHLGDRLDDDSRDCIARISASGDKMSKLIDGVLEYSRLARALPVRRPVELDALVREIVDELKVRYPATAVVLHPLGGTEADPTMVRQVFVNLIDNAFKYSARAAAPRIEVGAEAGEYFVRDNGVGFDMAHAEHLFTLFTRLHSDPTVESTGAGLAIVKRLVERHGGRISASAAPGQGATFRFSL